MRRTISLNGSQSLPIISVIPSEAVLPRSISVTMICSPAVEMNSLRLVPPCVDSPPVLSAHSVASEIL